jgi:hypothetical protein
MKNQPMVEAAMRQGVTVTRAISRLSRLDRPQTALKTS